MIALLVDIGNTRIKWCIARVDGAGAQPTGLADVQAMPVVDGERIADRFAAGKDQRVETVWCSNVASDAVEGRVRDAASRVWPAATWRTLRPVARQCGVVNGYREPTRLGTDRWLAMIGAHARLPDRPLLVCSFGTATTIDLLMPVDDPDDPRAARFIGGLILPGFDAMRSALSTGTARLPLADGRTVDFAVSTDDAIASGIAAAQAGAVERAVRQAQAIAARSGRGPIACLLTGGGSAAAAALLDPVDGGVEVAQDLVLLGMAAVAADETTSGHRGLSPTNR